MMRCRRSKAIAFLFVFLLAGHESVRIQDLSGHVTLTSAASRSALSHNSSSLSKWMWNYGSPACPLSYTVDASKERYHIKVERLHDAVERLEAQHTTTALMWRLREVGQRLEGLATCAIAAVSKPALLETVKDATIGLKALETSVMDKVLDQLRQHGIINWPETPTCKVKLESITEEQIRMSITEVGSEVNVVSSTRVLIFGADCDVDEYMSSPALSRISRKVLQGLSDKLVKFAIDSQKQGNLKATEAVLQQNANSLENLPSDDDRDDSETLPADDAAALVQTDADSRVSIPFPSTGIGNLIAVILLTVIVIAGFIGITTGVSNLFSSNDDEDTSVYQGAENITVAESTRRGRKRRS